MERFVKGDIVVVPFPFSGGAGDKRRPALVLASWPCLNSTDYLLCMISAQNVNEPYILALNNADVENGSLNRQSYVRPSYMFAIGEARISRKLGNVSAAKMQEILTVIKTIFA